MKKQTPTPMSDIMNSLEYQILCITFNSLDNNATATKVNRILQKSVPTRGYSYVARKIRELTEHGYLEVCSPQRQWKSDGHFNTKNFRLTMDGMNAMRDYVKFLSGVATTNGQGCVPLVQFARL